ncbi:hypothetical protein HDU76_006697 [Blyttiomyces sp. JEL0837]|nr:hypothetical protein HDU76_006697 [Blyttiomyces sp. JEL0837]
MIDKKFSGEFRSVTIVFVKLTFEFDTHNSQLAIAAFLRCLKKYEGVFQQFSVDDKGQTMLAVFGLPLFSHSNEPEPAVKAAVEFNDFAYQNLHGKASIGISTGEILFATLGTDSRREASLLGDVVNIAARLMSVDGVKGGIVIDDATHSGSTHSFVHHDIGEHYIKGKDVPLHLWTVQSAGLGPVVPTVEVFGYDEEKKFISDSYLKWKVNQVDSIILIEAASGLGKSTLGTFATNLARGDSVGVCLIQGTEIDQRTPYFGMCGVISFAYTHFCNTRPSNKGLKAGSEAGSSVSMTTSKYDSGSASRKILTQLPRKASLKASSLKSEVNAKEFKDVDTPAYEFMKYHGENPNMAPLLRIVIPSLRISDTEQTAKLDSQAKNNLLKTPIADTGSDVLNRISAHSRVKYLKLQGLSRSAVEEIIVNKCSQPTRPISSVEDTLLEGADLTECYPSYKVQKGSRFPLYTDMIGSLLRDKIGKELIIDAGCLKLKQGEAEVDSILFSTVGAAIISQYDR